jgi:hypothetical protein
MDNGVFDRLLYEGESTTLDFKAAQYPFVKATDYDKSELLKDILGFANAFRRSEAYILIGVNEIQGGRADVVGIAASDHLADHSLQQFVNNLTNRPVRFHYESHNFEGNQVGVIRIEEAQARPLYLKKDYGKLRRQEVYVRRGSSTDHTKPAGPDEIAAMLQGPIAGPAELEVEFAKVDGDDSLGTHVEWRAELLVYSDGEIPDYGHLSPVDAYLTNKAYYREMAEYQFVRRLFRPARVVIKNIGQVPASEVRVELVLAATSGAIVIHQADMPRRPQTRWMAPIPRLTRHLVRNPGEVTVDANSDRHRVEIDFGTLQPGRRVCSETFYLGKKKSGEFAIDGQVFSSNLPQPIDFTLSASVNVTETRYTLIELLGLANQ